MTDSAPPTEDLPVEAAVSLSPAVAPTQALSLASIYREYHDLVWRSLRGMGVPEAGVDDATQDVFVIVHARLDSFDATRGSMRGWLFGIARMVSRKYWEKAARRGAREVSSEPVESAADSSAGLPINPDRALDRQEAAELVQQFLDGLDEDKRTVFYLAEIEELSAPEIAEMLDVKLNTIYSRLRLSRTRFEAFINRHQAIARREGGHV